MVITHTKEGEMGYGERGGDQIVEKSWEKGSTKVTQEERGKVILRGYGSRRGALRRCSRMISDLQ